MKSKKSKIEFRNKILNWVFFWGVVGASVFALLFLVTSTWIGVEVRGRCEAGKAKYGGDCVEALVATVEDENNSLRERNYAIWSLGMMGDKRGLPVLEEFYTGVIPDREPYNETLSQYEMKQAIKLIDGGFNATAWVWR